MFNRRVFLGTAAAGLTVGSLANANKAANQLVVGVMGTGGRGTGLAQLFAQQQDIVVAYVCDADKKRAQSAAGAVEKITSKAPEAVQDFRKILDDSKVDVLVVATCNHWHAPATILANAAGKHVYVEKPCSHNPHEGELLVESAKKTKKKIQVGNQRRSWTAVQEAVELVRSGEAIGRAYYAQSWYTSNRPSIGRGKEMPPPDGLDYDLWQGPAARKPFRSNFLHYNWHWFWNWGNGELGNNGIHMIDLCRWGLGVDYPTKVTSSGGRYQFDDDQETPDTHVVAFDFPGKKSIVWQGHSCNQFQPGLTADLMFVGEKGSLVVRGNTYAILDEKGKEVKKGGGGKSSDKDHLANFFEAIRSDRTLNSGIEEAQKSTLLCHLGNIAHRMGRSVKCDAANGHILDDKAAMELWSREYAKGWEPKV